MHKAEAPHLAVPEAVQVVEDDPCVEALPEGAGVPRPATRVAGPGGIHLPQLLL